MRWVKQGLIFDPKKLLTWSKSHAQLPILLRTEGDKLFIIFTTRNDSGISVPSYFIYDYASRKILKASNKPIMDLGQIGAFDDAGVMPTYVLNTSDITRVFYIGWNNSCTVPYRNSIGLAKVISTDMQLERFYEGPIIDRTRDEPFFCGTFGVLKMGSVYFGYYMSCTEWKEVKGKIEPRYHIKLAKSNDGVNWIREGKIAIDYIDDNEGGIASATVLNFGGKFHMWFSYRKYEDYRTNVEASYNIGYASSVDGENWTREDNKSGIAKSSSGWDSQMICYPYVFKHGKKILMLYNGNGFGESGIGLAELEDYEL